jgi:hypothetical protein
MSQTSRLASLFVMFFVVATSSAADVTVQDYMGYKDDPSQQQQINAYFLGAVNAWVFANDAVSSVTDKQLFCVDEDQQHLSVKSVRALLEARIESIKYYKDHPESTLHPIIFETLVNNFPCGKLSLFPTVSSAPGTPMSQSFEGAKDLLKQARSKASPKEPAHKESGGEHTTIFSALDASIPNWRIVNEQSEFLAWLDRYDPLTGETRQKTLMTAFNTNDSRTVVGIFNAYLREKPTAH